MVGKTFRGKINGALFFVEELRQDNGKQYYIIRDLKSGAKYTHDKGWFEYGIMQNLEEVTDDKQKGN